MLTTCRRAQPEDFPAIERMLELYQYELSDIWNQDLDDQGKYGYDLSRHIEGARFIAHVTLEGSRFAGFALVAPAVVTQTEGFWMEQFFILKKYRRTGLGKALAFHVFQHHPGPWEVGQLLANRAAQTFWRNVIAQATNGRFTEVKVTKGWWKGIAQRFNVQAAARPFARREATRRAD